MYRVKFYYGNGDSRNEGEGKLLSFGTKNDSPVAIILTDDGSFYHSSLNNIVAIGKDDEPEFENVVPVTTSSKDKDEEHYRHMKDIGMC